MPIVNIDSLSPRSGYKTIRNWGDRDYWYVVAQINNELVVPNEIVHSDYTIVVSTDFEAYQSIVGQIYDELVVKLNILPNRILLLSENHDLADVIIKEANQRNKGLIQYECTMVFELSIKIQTSKYYSNRKNIIPKTSAPEKYFLNFNRRWRIQRPTFVALLYASGLQDKGHISLPVGDTLDGKEYNWYATIDAITTHIKNDDHLYSLIKNNSNIINNIPPLYLDTNKLDVNRVRLYYDDIDHNDTTKLYNDTAFSIVNETFFFENKGRFLSEKTFKPMSYYHPFILITEPFSLELLRDLGYKTFEPFIDESYDRELDNAKRMRMILQEVERLCKMNTVEMNQFLKNVAPITEHNFNRLVTSNSHSYKIL
jgi:hypothetical protein